MKPMSKRATVAGVKVDLRTALRSSCVVVCVGLASCGGPTVQAAPSTGEPGPLVLPGATADAGPVVVAEADPKQVDPKQADPKDPGPPPKDDPPAKVVGELIHTVTTSKSRVDMSASLVKPAADAASKREFGRAIRYYNALVVARGPGSAEAHRLAELWALAGQPEDAKEVLRAFIASSSDDKAIKLARQDLANLDKVRDIFGSRLELPSLDKEAKKVFDLGRAAYKKKKWADSLVYFHMGLALAPDLPGFLRELGGTYDKLGAKDKKIEFYERYLRARPFGKNADAIRKEIPKGTLGSLSVASTLPCDLVLINRQPLPVKKLPAKNLKLAAGIYKGMCINGQYELIVFDRVEIKAGASATLEFKWAVLINALENPMGRIAVENAREPGTMMDLGITSPELGVVLPDDGRALKIILKDDSGARTEERFIKFTPGEKKVIKW